MSIQFHSWGQLRIFFLQFLLLLYFCRNSRNSRAEGSDVAESSEEGNDEDSTPSRHGTTASSVPRGLRVSLQGATGHEFSFCGDGEV